MPRMPWSHRSASTPISNEEVEVTETNALRAQDFDEEYGEVHPGSTVPRSLKPVIQDSSDQSNCAKYCFIPCVILAMIIIYGSLLLVFEDLGYEDIYTYFIVPASATMVAGSGSGFLESCRDNIWWGPVCEFFPPAASAVHGPRRTIGCDMVALSPEPCDELTLEIVPDHYISCESFNVLEKSTYDYCGEGWGDDSNGYIGSYTPHGHG